MRQSDKDRYLKRIVRYCIAASSVLLAVGIALAVIGYDVLDYVTVGIGVFGGELLLTCVIRLVGDKDEQATTKANRTSANRRENG